MEHISTLLPNVLRKRGIKDEADASLVIYVANQWLQEQGGLLAASVAAKTFAPPNLTLMTQSSVAASEVHARTGDLLQALHERFPALAIEQVRILRS